MTLAFERRAPGRGQRQYSGTVGGTENCRVGTFLAVEYAFLALRGFLTAITVSSGYTTAGTDQRFGKLLVPGVAAPITGRAEQGGLSPG